MRFLLLVAAFVGSIGAVIIPSAFTQDEAESPKQLEARGASMPTVEDYVGTYLRNNAILAPPSCHSFIAAFSFPSTPTINVTQCRDVCDRITKSGSARKCRFFNMYTLFKNGANQGMQCVAYDRGWGSKFATNNGTFDGRGRARNTLGVGNRMGSGTSGSGLYEVSNSFSYSLIQDPGNQTCGTMKDVMSTLNLPLAMGRPSPETAANISVASASGKGPSTA